MRYNNVPPRAGFAFGNRYELGYHDQGHGWTVGVLDGPELNQTQFFGFAPNAATDGGIPPFIDADYTDRHDIGPGDWSDCRAWHARLRLRQRAGHVRNAARISCWAFAIT